jgi:hypothetical protein
MSNIPRAREVLEEAMRGKLDPIVAIESALSMMTRRKPDFVAPRRLGAMNAFHVEHAKTMRRAGMAINDIARNLGTNIGRVSEAINN